MTAASSRLFIAAMQVTLDGHILGPEAEVDWVDSWADGLGLLPEVDAFVLGGGMFPEYEQFWTAIRDDAAVATELLGRAPYEREIEYARVAAATPHLVLSTTLDEVSWPTARLIRDLDELRLILHPVAVGAGRSVFGQIRQRQELEMLRSKPTAAGCMQLTYRLPAAPVAVAA